MRPLTHHMTATRLIPTIMRVPPSDLLVIFRQQLLLAVGPWSLVGVPG